MKISELWLREWVDYEFDVKKLAHLLTMSGLEVDALIPVAAAFSQVIVAEVMTTTPHPQADRLTVCEINTGKGPLLKVVCGASNVRPGLKVALAEIGANLSEEVEIKESNLRGELSQGMLCSAAELGLAETSEGLLELAADAPLGANLRDYLFLNDTVLDIDLTPNRADCFSVLGIARELSALTKSILKSKQSKKIQPTIDENLTIYLNAPEACPCYSGRIIRGINSQASVPLWMKERLRRAGLRTIHPVVDVTNYVMLELGQPMHAFDLNKIQKSIQIRFATTAEDLELLDGQQLKLNDKVLVIADAEKPLALAGVMGGAETAVQEETQDIFLESAFFNPLTIATAARHFGLITDSSQRYERGVDPSLPLQALERATELLLEIVGGEAGPISFLSEANFLPKKIQLTFNPTKVKQLTGLTIPEEEMLLMLNSLGMKVNCSQSLWLVEIPSYRFDLRFEADLVEEIIRLYGYDKIPGEKMMATVQAGSINACEALAVDIGKFFIARGYHETISYSFVDPQIQQILYPNLEVMQLLNPISSELSQMRVGMWPGLLASMIHNIHRQQTAIKFFENGVVFELQDGLLKEHQCIAGLLIGPKGAMNWCETTRNFDFYDLKGDLLALFQHLDLQEIQFLPAEHPALHPGKSALINIKEQQLGWCGVLHPRVAATLDLQEEVILFDLRLISLITNKTVRYKQISKYPQIRRDLSFLVANEISADQIEKALREVVPADLLKSFDVFDLYLGESIPKGKKSLAIALTLQEDRRTMVDSEINEIISAIIKKLNNKFSIIMRD